MISFNRSSREHARRSETASFEPGTLVRHRRFGYRGVVVHADDSCQADDQWYSSNQTQPDRNQPWYHVLVHGTPSCTYAASENLDEDLSGLPIEHPLLSQFFTALKNGVYVRNDRPWPNW